MTFIYNAWYVAGWSVELGAEQLQSRTLLEQPLVLFRQSDGTPAALQDLCPHRFLPLSMGERQTDGTIQCGYHGLRFDGQGQCVRVPGQTRIPKHAQVRSYPVAERMGMIWVWMGDPERADPATIFDLPQYHQTGWGVGYGDRLQIKARYLSLAENLCDPAHVSFVHKTTLGSRAGEEVPVSSERLPNSHTVLTSRWTLNSPAVGFFQVFGDFDDQPVDRWQYYYLHAPCVAVIDFGSILSSAGNEHKQRDAKDAVRVFSCHFLTPETATSSVDYWLHVRNFEPEDHTVSAAISDQFRIAFAEDKTILEAVQINEQRFPNQPPVNIASDSGAARLRQVIAELAAAESHQEKNIDE